MANMEEEVSPKSGRRSALKSITSSTGRVSDRSEVHFEHAGSSASHQSKERMVTTMSETTEGGSRSMKKYSIPWRTGPSKSVLAQESFLQPRSLECSQAEWARRCERLRAGGGITAAAPEQVELEDNIAKGDWIVGRLRHGEPSAYVYARIEEIGCPGERVVARGSHGERYTEADFLWVVKTRDDGWLEPLDDLWRTPGRPIFLRLLEKDEWVAAWSTLPRPNDPIRQGVTYLPLDGLVSLKGVILEEEVGMLFTPHEECIQEFGNLQPRHGGHLFGHLRTAFIAEESQRDSTRQRWTIAGRGKPQYPMRCVYVHPSTKERALSEFIRRCHKRTSCDEFRQACGNPSNLDLVMLLGPPAAGKSSIERLPPGQVPEDVEETRESLRFREEVNNDNLTDCMPKFREEFSQAMEVPTVLSSKETRVSISKFKLDKATSFRFAPGGRDDEHNGVSNGADTPGATSPSRKGLRCVSEHGAEVAAASPHPARSGHRRKTEEPAAQRDVRNKWALQWLVYAMFHHGPIRDSVAWDVIKVTVIDAPLLRVFYSSVMAGAAIDRTMEMLRLAKTTMQPVPHRALRIVGFWPWASQEARAVRQNKRHNLEVAGKQLLGGNADSNLVNLHYHAQQAEHNIIELLRRVKAESRSLEFDHLLFIDNDRLNPRVLLDFSTLRGTGESLHMTFGVEIQAAARALVSSVRKLGETSPSLQSMVYRVGRFFLPANDEVLKNAPLANTEAHEVLGLLTELDEEVFQRVNPDHKALPTADRAGGQPMARKLSEAARGKVQSLSIDDAERIKNEVSVLRKFCVVTAVQKVDTIMESS